jgi:hypothetical protein
MATRFDARNVAEQCAKENRFEGGNLQESSPAIRKGTQQQLFPLFNATEELDQLTRPDTGSPTSLSRLIRSGMAFQPMSLSRGPAPFDRLDLRT